MRKKLRRGGGEFIGFAIGMLGLCTLILMLLGVFQLCMASSQLENAANLISRDIVSEESLDAVSYTHLKEGSRVNIYTTGGDANGTTLLFQNMRVLSVEKDSNGCLLYTSKHINILYLVLLCAK